MKTYIFEMQIAFQDLYIYDLLFLAGSVFSYCKKVLMALIENLFAYQQTQELVVRQKIIMTEKKIKQYYNSPDVSRSTTKGYQSRLVFDFLLLTSLRPWEVQKITVD